MSIVTLPPLPPLTRADEIRFVGDLSDWLAEQTLPASAIVWRPNWRSAISVDSAVSLRRLVVDLPPGDHAGIERKGSNGPWAQVRAFEDRGVRGRGWPFELHPHKWSLGVPHGVWKLISDDVNDVAEALWSWVAVGMSPAEHPEPTTRPTPGWSFW